MRTFAANYFEPMEPGKVNQSQDWNWTPAKPKSEIEEIWASGAPTKTQQSTYASEKDERGDDDRPNEGLA